MLHTVAISFAVTFGLLQIIFRIVSVVLVVVSVVTEEVLVVVSVVSLMFLSCLRQVYEVYTKKRSPAFWRPLLVYPGYPPLGVPADLKSAVKKYSTY